MPYETLLSALSQEDQYELQQSIEIRTYQKNEIVFKEKSKTTGIYCIISGSVKRFILGLDGKEYIFEFCGANEIFGHRNIFTTEENFDSSVATTVSEIAFVPKRLFLKLIQKYETVNMNYIRLLNEESVRQIKHSQVISQLSLRQRMAHYLLYLQTKNADSNNWTVEISRDDLANLIGTVKESAVRTLQEFKSDGTVIASGRKIFIAKPDVLRKAARTEIQSVAAA